MSFEANLCPLWAVERKVEGGDDGVVSLARGEGGGLRNWGGGLEEERGAR